MTNVISEGKLFIEGKIFAEYAYFGWGGEDAQFFVYSEGYKNAADILIENAIGQSDHNLKDKLVFPIIFSYRQYLELIMKHLFIEYSEITREEKEKVINKKDHSLEGIWNSLRLIIEKYVSEEDMDSIYILEQYIKEFHEYDVKGDAFRYPVNRKLNLHHTEWTYLDLVNLKNRMNDIYELFDIIDLDLREKKDIESELLSYQEDFES